MSLRHGAYILARYSTDNQEADSIEVQVERCTAWCKAQGLPVLDIFADFAVSGMKDTRPQYERMMGLLRQGQADTVVILDQSRMFRKMTAWFAFREELENLGVRIVSVTQPQIGGDLRDPAAFMAEGSWALINQVWVLQTRQKVVDKMRHMAELGLYTGGTPPLGYRVEDKRLVIDPAEAETVREIFRRYAAGWSYRKIIEDLNLRGIKTKRGGAFGTNSLHDLLKNRKYIGTLTYGRVSQRPDGRSNNHRDSENMIVKENGCPAIIDRELFDQVQEKLAGNRHTGGRAPIEENYYLRGRVFCGECGSSMHIHYASSRKDRAYYMCAAQKRTHQCENKPIRASRLESAVAAAVRDLLGTPGKRQHLLQILRAQCAAVTDTAGPRIAALTLRRKELQGQLNNATDAVLRGLTSDTLLNRIQQLENEKASVEYQLDQLRQDLQKASLPEDQIAAALDSLTEGELADEAALALVYRVEVKPDGVDIWTILDDPDDPEKHKKIPPAELPAPPEGPLYNCTVRPGSTNNFTTVVVAFRTARP